MSFTETLVEFLVGSRFRDLPEETIRHTKAVVLDYLACVLAGSTASGVPELAKVAQRHGHTGACTLLVLGGRVEPLWAAMVNAAMGHALDFDDTHDRAVLHTSTVVVPAAFALAESTGASGEEFLLAVTLAMDLHCRLGLAATVQPADLGWIYTPLMGVFASAAVASKLLRLDTQHTLDSLGLAYSLAAGNHQALNEGTLAKRLQPAFASSNGVLAALLSEAGLTGPHQPFEGTFGLFNVYLRGNVNPSKALANLGETFEGDALSLKPYPSCRHTHSGIDSMVQAYQRGIRAENVEEVRLQVNRAAYAAVCEPEALKYAPRTIVDAQFSLPYTAACALAHGWVYIDDFTAAGIARPHILKLAAKVKVAIDPGIQQSESRQITPATAVIRLRDGQEERIVVPLPKGSPSNPMTDDECATKLSDCARHCAMPFSESLMREVARRVNDLDKASTPHALLELLAPAVNTTVFDSPRRIPLQTAEPM